MRSLRLSLLIGVWVAALPIAAHALQVTISYSITGGTNASSVLGGAAPTSGTATVRAPKQESQPRV